MIMEKGWDAMNPPKNEEELIGQWFACVFKSTKTPNLYIGKIRKRFLTAEVNEKGYVAAVEMDIFREHKALLKDMSYQSRMILWAP